MKIESPHRSDPKRFLQAVLIGGLLVFAALIVLQQANPARNKLGRDSGAFAYIGSRILRGEPPYLTAWDSKPPGTFIMDAAGLWLGRGTRWGIWFIEFISLSATAIFGFLAMQKQFGLGAAMLASMLWLYGLNGVLIGGNLTEEYSLFFGFLSILFFILSLDKKSTAWMDFGIGLCAGFGFIFRPNNVGVEFSIILVISILSIIEKQYLGLVRRLLVIGLAALLPLGALSAYLISKGALQAFWEAAITYNFFYAGSHLFDPFGTLSNGFVYLDFVAHIALLGLIITVSEIGFQLKNRFKVTPILLWIALDGMVEIMLSALSGRNYLHYFINWLPFIAFAGALLIARILPWLVNWAQKKTLVFLVVFALVFCVYFQAVLGRYWKGIGPLLFDRSGRVQYIDPVSEYVNVNTSPNQKVLVWGGQAGINFLSRRDSSTRYLFYPVYVPSKITDRMSEDFYKTLVANPPILIVDGNVYDDKHIIPLSAGNPLAWLSEHQAYNTPYLLETLKFIHENYVLADNVNGADIYRLKR